MRTPEWYLDMSRDPRVEWNGKCRRGERRKTIDCSSCHQPACWSSDVFLSPYTAKQNCCLHSAALEGHYTVHSYPNASWCSALHSSKATRGLFPAVGAIGLKPPLYHNLRRSRRKQLRLGVWNLIPEPSFVLFIAWNYIRVKKLAHIQSEKAINKSNHGMNEYT